MIGKLKKILTCLFTGVGCLHPKGRGSASLGLHPGVSVFSGVCIQGCWADPIPIPRVGSHSTAVAEPRGGGNDAPPPHSRSDSFHFHAVFGKDLAKIIVFFTLNSVVGTTSRLENPGAANNRVKYFVRGSSVKSSSRLPPPAVQAKTGFVL